MLCQQGQLQHTVAACPPHIMPLTCRAHTSDAYGACRAVLRMIGSKLSATPSLARNTMSSAGKRQGRHHRARHILSYRVGMYGFMARGTCTPPAVCGELHMHSQALAIRPVGAEHCRSRSWAMQQGVNGWNPSTEAVAKTQRAAMTVAPAGAGLAGGHGSDAT